jgi:hypothetical protein
MKTTHQTTEVPSVETVLELLDQAPNLEHFTFSLWMFWCESVTINTREFQQVLANKSVNSWFLQELKKEQDECLAILERYENITQSDQNKLYVKCVVKLFSRFPLALLQQAKKRDVKPQTTRVAGHKIEFSIINQN